MSDEYIPASADWGINDFMGNAVYPPDLSESVAELDEVGRWPTLEAAAARTGMPEAPPAFVALSPYGPAGDDFEALAQEIAEVQRLQRHNPPLEFDESEAGVLECRYGSGGGGLTGYGTEWWLA